MNKTIKRLAITLLTIGSLAGGANAEIKTYLISFSGANSPTSGTFKFDTEKNVFTSFTVESKGEQVSFLPSVNRPVTQRPSRDYKAPSFTPLMVYQALTTDLKYKGLDVTLTWSNYPPNPKGNSFDSSLNFFLGNSDRAGAVIGGSYSDPNTITPANKSRGTFTVRLRRVRHVKK